MPLAERDPNASGRTSRASNMSAGSRGTSKPAAGAMGDGLFSTPGVMSMLRTTTELGDIGSITNDAASTKHTPRGPLRRAGTSSRLSTASSHSNKSRKTNRHQHWPSTSSGPHRSLTHEINEPQYVADTLSPTIMNLPLSSPLIPHSRHSRDGRSYSMTHTSHPAYSLTSNPSFASLRNDRPPRPKSPYRYPARLRRPGYRPPSPAMSDTTGTQSKRLHTQLGYHPRARGTSDFSVHRDDRTHMGPPIRNRSSPLLPTARSELPFSHRSATSSLHMPAKASFSSSSMRLRTDSSSDAQPSQPPTPKDDTSMEVLVGSTGTEILVAGMDGAHGDTSTEPVYYDYSEDFEREPTSDANDEGIPTGFVHRIKTIIEERSTGEQTTKTDVTVVREVVELPGSEFVAELSASPAPKRITRDMIKAVLEPASNGGDSTTDSIKVKSPDAPPAQAEGRAQAAAVETPPEGVHAGNNADGQKASSQVTAHRASMSVPRSSISHARGSGPETEDGMSDLLDDYQHDPKPEEVPPPASGRSTRKSTHSQRSSDAESFKSCTDTKENEKPLKDSDAKSFTTCKDVVSPLRAASMPASSNAPLALAPDSSATRPASVAVPRTPALTPTPTPTVASRKPVPAMRDSGSAKPAPARLHASSRVSSRQGSTVASISSAASISQPPVVPPRESSSSKEAQRTQAVADFLLRLSRPRFSGFSRKSARDETSSQNGPASPVDRAAGKEAAKPTPNAKTPESKPRDLKEQSARATEASAPGADRGRPEQARRAQVSTSTHRQSFSAPSPLTSEPSSVYSTEPSKSGTQWPASPVRLDFGRRDSQTTTHLVWNGRKSTSSDPTVEPRPRRGGQDESTTDLRLSAFRYPLHYLPDLKEESHEDSSLNTSASNVKSSSFRFPPGLGSMDDAHLFRNPSVKSAPNKALAQTRNLPSLNFSRINLIAKLNEALDLGSLDLDDSEVAEPSPARPTSGDMREKYRSFFASLEGLEKAEDGKARSGQLGDLMPFQRPMSSDELVAEIDNLTIPSVGGLTQRLSEMLPSLKHYYQMGDDFSAEKLIMEHALEELDGVCGPVPAPKRSSARLRPMAGHPNLVVMDDGLYYELTGGEDEVTVGPDGRARGSGEEVNAADLSIVTARDGLAVSSPPTQLSSPVVLRTRSVSLGNPEVHRPSFESRLSCRSLRSFTSTPTADTTRPWNSDKNYPWASTLQSVDISLPLRTAAVRASPLGPSRLRLRLSDSSDTTARAAMGPRSKAAEPAASEPALTHTTTRSRSNCVSSSTRPGTEHHHRRGRVGFSRDAEALHDAGERYPTTSLTPPSALDIEVEPVSYFSDDSEDERPSGLKSKLARLRARKSKSTSATRPALAPHASSTSSRAPPRPPPSSEPPGPAPACARPQPRMAHSDSMPNAAAEARAFTFSHAAGMPKTEFVGRRLLDKLKLMLVKGSDLLRSLSLSSRRRQRRSASSPRTSASAAVEVLSSMPVDPPAPPGTRIEHTSDGNHWLVLPNGDRLPLRMCPPPGGTLASDSWAAYATPGRGAEGLGWVLCMADRVRGALERRGQRASACACAVDVCHGRTGWPPACENQSVESGKSCPSSWRQSRRRDRLTCAVQICATAARLYQRSRRAASTSRHYGCSLFASAFPFTDLDPGDGDVQEGKVKADGVETHQAALPHHHHHHGLLSAPSRQLLPHACYAPACFSFLCFGRAKDARAERSGGAASLMAVCLTSPNFPCPAVSIAGIRLCCIARGSSRAFLRFALPSACFSLPPTSPAFLRAMPYPRVIYMPTVVRIARARERRRRPRRWRSG